MTTQTLRPNATVAAGSFTATGAASLWQATSDNSDASYAGTSALNNPMVLGLGAYTLASNERVRTFQLRARCSSSSAASVAGSVQVASGGLTNLFNVNAAGTAATTYSSGQQTPSSEVSNNAILDAVLAVMQTFSESAAGLRAYELYLDLDVRARPTISALSVNVVIGEPTYSVTFSYNTSGNLESVNVNVVVIDDATGAVVASLVQAVSGTDFSGQVVNVPHGEVLPNGSYTVQATISAPGFVAPDTSFLSAVSETQFTVTPAGVAPPELSCATDQAAQKVCLTISQPDDVLPPETDCLRMEVFGTGAFGNQAGFTGAGTEVISAPDSASLDLTGNITVIVWARATDWTPATVRTIFSKAPATSLTGYSANVQTSGLLNFVIGTGAAARTMASTAPSLTDGEGYWLEFFYDNTAKTCRFRKSSDPLYTSTANLTWTTISTSAAHAGGSPTANTNTLQVGALATTLQWVGAIGYLAVNNQLGTNVAEADFRPRAVGAAAFVDGSGNTWTFAGGAAVATNSVTLTTVGQPRHVSVWINNVLTTADLVFGATSVTLAGDTVGLLALNSNPPYVAVATTGGGVSNVVLVAYQVSSSGTVLHGLNTINLIVQGRQGSTRLQGELGITVVDANEIFVDTIAESVSVLLLAQSAFPVCVPTIDESVLAATQNQQFAHQFSSLLTMTTFVRTSDNRVSWVGVELNSGSIVVDNDGGAGTIHISGYLAVFDDPDAVRAEVQRDGELIPLDGLNGALVPPFGDGGLVVCDRFPARYRAPTCEDDPEPTGPTYRVRFYGYVDGVVAYSPWSECTPAPVLTNGQALLRHPFDEDLDVEGCVSMENWQRIRPMSAAQPVTGGLEVVRTGDLSGRDLSLVLEAPDTVSQLALEALLAAAYIWYAPLDVNVPTLWMAPGSSVSVSGYKNDARPYSTTQGFVEVEAEEVDLPPAGPTAS